MLPLIHLHQSDVFGSFCDLLLSLDESGAGHLPTGLSMPDVYQAKG